jgi:hypothetical protein
MMLKSQALLSYGEKKYGTHGSRKLFPLPERLIPPLTLNPSPALYSFAVLIDVGF